MRRALSLGRWLTSGFNRLHNPKNGRTCRLGLFLEGYYNSGLGLDLTGRTLFSLGSIQDIHSLSVLSPGFQGQPLPHRRWSCPSFSACPAGKKSVVMCLLRSAMLEQSSRCLLWLWHDWPAVGDQPTELGVPTSRPPDLCLSGIPTTSPPPQMTTEWNWA